MVKERIKKYVTNNAIFDFLKTGFLGVFDDIVLPLFSTEWGRRASWGALSLFGLLLVVVITQTCSGWYHDSVLIHAQAANRGAPADHMSLLIAQIPEEHLFGKLGLSDQFIPITSLQLHLIGVVKSDPENLSRVIISEAGQPGKVYAIGESLPSGITVNSITEDGVILENGGRMEKLPLQRSPLFFQGMPEPLLENRK